MSHDKGQKYKSDGTNFTTIRHDTYPYIDPKQFNLKGLHVLISGASKGVGKATAISFAQAGASKITLGARSPLSAIADEVKAAATASGHAEPEVLCLQLDVVDRANVERNAEEISARFNSLDILVNNAGYLSAFKGIPDSDPDEWWRDWETNVKGVYLMTRAFWPLLLKSQTKTIINLSSVGGVRMPPHGSAYGITKLAVLRFTEQINQDHGPGKDGMLAFAVHPGGVATELALRLPEQTHSFLVDTPEMGADTIVWLAAERREWLAGRYVNAGWDMEELTARKEEIVEGDLLKVRLAVNLFPA